MPPKAKAVTKFSSFEYQGYFIEPVFEAVRLHKSIGAVYAGLKPLKISPADVTYSGGTKTTDNLVTFQLAKNHYVVSLALGGFTFKADFVDWNQAPVIINVIETTSRALKEVLEIKIKEHHLQIVMQLVLPEVSLREFTKSFSPMLVRPAGDMEFSGFILHTTSGMFVIDKSAVHENGMFVRIVHRFQGEKSMDEMAQVLLEDEKWLGDALGVEIE